MTITNDEIDYNKLESYKNTIDNLDDNYTDNIIINIIKMIPKGSAGLKIRVSNLILAKTKELEAPIGVRYLNQLFKKLEILQEDTIYQIERTIAEQIVNKYTIITFDETGEMCLYGNGVFFRSKVSKAKIKREIFNIVINKYPEYQERMGNRSMILEIIRNMTPYSMDKFYLRRELINLRNGIILQKENGLIFKSHDILKREGKILYTFNQLPVDYKRGAKCPILDKILPEIFDKDQLIDVMEFMASTIFQSIRFNKAIIFQGPRDTGETTFLNMLTVFLGRKNISEHELYRLAKPFQVENLRFKIANISDEVINITLDKVACGRIKKLITNRYLGGEMKGIQGDEDWINYCKLICACNELPIPEDDSDAWWKRWIGISCINQFTGKKEDPKFKDMVWSKEEMSGFLNKCVIAWRRLHKRGKFRAKWKDPDYIKRWWMYNIKPVFKFAKDCCMVGNAGDRIDYEEFINKFNTRRKERGLTILSKSLITRELLRYDENISKKRVNIGSNPESSGYSYTNIRWADIMDPQYVEFAKIQLEKPKTKEKIEGWEKLKADKERKKRAFVHLEDGQEVDHADIF